MGDIGAVEANGVVVVERLVYNNPDPSSIAEDYWAVAEETVQEVVNCIHPTLDSEEKRNDVIDYVQRLIRCSLGFEVFPYGSVPLKTYLPDGDIDLTVLSSPCAEESWVNDILSVLKAEEQNPTAEYEVKDTQFIDAEVKLVKCLVRNIVIDISFNQLGGLRTLCFLEQVDRLAGKNHLFKRSIILIKAWCYYESRILGAHHGLISTYALETLVLYIFHLFHSSFNGPLAVLYRFLDYFSKFDWENYCISLNGPVCKASLPDIVVQMPQNEGHDLMLSEEFFRNCMEMFSTPSRDSETTTRAFPAKHLNIFDPLKEYNNLGRSVHRGNFYRIRSAFRYGACKLGRVLSLPRDEIADEIKKFFSNTLQRHGSKNGSDRQDYALLFGAEGSDTLYSLSSVDAFSEDDMLLRSSTCGFEDEGLTMEEKCTLMESDRCSMKVVSSEMMSKLGIHVEGALSGHHVNGDAYDLATYSFLDFMTSNGTSDCSPSSNYSGSFFGQYYHAPEFFLPKSSAENGHFNRSETSDGVEEKLDPNPWLEHTENHLEMVNTYQSCEDNLDSFCSCSSAVSSPKTSILESLSLDFRERDSTSVVDAEPFNPLADLTGDYDSHIRSLLYGQGCHGFALSAPILSNSPASPSGFGLKKPWDTAYQSMLHTPTSCSGIYSDTVFMGPPASVIPPCSPFASEEKHKARGTGTYLPIKKSFCRNRRPSQGRSRNKVSDTHGQLHRHTRSNGFLPTFSETNSLGKGSHEVLQTWCPVQSHEKSGEVSQSYDSNGVDTRTNSFSKSSCTIEFGSLGHFGDDVVSGDLIAGGSTPTASLDKQTSVLNKREERVADQSFHLKNEDEFPPLSL